MINDANVYIHLARFYNKIPSFQIFLKIVKKNQIQWFVFWKLVNKLLHIGY